MPKRLMVEIDADLERRVKNAAAQQGRTLDDVIAAALRVWIEEAEQPRMVDIDPIFKLAGKYSGSTEDVAANVSEILRADVDPAEGFTTGRDRVG